MATANHYLAANPQERQVLLGRVILNAQPKGECLISSYAACSETSSGKKKSKTAYPTTSFTHPSDGKKRKYYAHHVVMMSKRADEGISEMWDTSAFQVSHDCHNTFCIKKEHLSLISAKENRDKNIHCIGRVVCVFCGISFFVCEHPVPCLTEVTRVCSSCDQVYTDD